MIKSLWLTVNRKCNFRCLWCYAKGSKYEKKDDMTLEKAINLFKIGIEIGIENVVILGGEPTLWKPLPELIRRINEIDSGIVPVIVTNGYLFSKKSYLKKFDGLKYEVGLSVKAGTKEQYVALTEVDCFEKIASAIKNLTNENRLSGVSVTINNRIVDDLVTITDFVAKSGGKAISFEMCAPSFDNDGNPNDEYLINPAELAQKIMKFYPEINRIMNGNVFFQLSLPFCLFTDDFIKNLMDNERIISGCHVFRRDGVIFNSKGEVLLCNCLYHLPIGTYGSDFVDAKSFNQWWNKREVRETNEKLLSYPSVKCIGCEQYQYCGGGCCLQWFCLNPQKIIQGVLK